MNLITVNAVSLTDPGTTAEAEIKVSVEYPKNSEGCYVVALEGSPFAGEAVIIPLSHPVLEPNSGGQGISLDIAEWAEYEGIGDLDTAGCEIHGTDNPDQISGSVARDMIYGYGGDDGLSGGEGSDVLNGGDGDNTLNGGMGIDQFTGGIDADVILPGDTDADGAVDLRDALLTLKFLAGASADAVDSDADVNGDEKIGTEELIYILQVVSGLRP